jgi:hypothetical protein
MDRVQLGGAVRSRAGGAMWTPEATTPLSTRPGLIERRG